MKRLIPRRIQILIRRKLASYILHQYKHLWPIDRESAKPPDEWPGWPAEKKFALVLTHDVEKVRGLDKCHKVAELEKRHGFRSSFNFVPRNYQLPSVLYRYLTDCGFEVGVHGLYHDKNSFRSKSLFKKHAIEINRYLKEWGSVGFRSPCMYRDLNLLHNLNIEYDASTFDTDPFEPQPDGVGTIFPFWVTDNAHQKGYAELPYTLPQDFLLFILMQEQNIDIWQKKLDWIAENGGMALCVTHPDYMNFDETSHYEEYPASYYEEFLVYIKSKYAGQYWNVLPREMARWCKRQAPILKTLTTKSAPKRICMLVYSFYESDNRVMRYAETLAKRGDQVDVIALRKAGQPFYESLRGVNVYRIQKRIKDEKSQLSHLYRLIKFLIVSSIFLTKKHIKNRYHLIHVNNVPDFLVFAALLPKLFGAKVILDIHDIVPELYATIFNQTKKDFLFKSLVMVEKASCDFSDHVIIANDIWYKLITSRSVTEDKCSVVLNYPDENIFSRRKRERQDNKFIMIYPGSLNRRQGVDIAIKAFALIKDKIPMVEFHIYGDGGDRNYLESLVFNLGLQNHVFLKGSLPIYEVAEKMANADLGIEPKRNDMFAGDAMSTKILEFMSLEIPVIASDTRVHKYYFNESTVLFFKSGDEEDLARCMLSLFENADLRQQMLLNTQQFVQDYVWDKKKEEYLKLIDKLTQKVSE